MQPQRPRASASSRTHPPCHGQQGNLTTVGVLNYIWLALVLLGVLIGGWTDHLKEVTNGALEGAKTAVTIALGLIGIMALWLGVMRLAERAGLVQRIARILRPLMQRLFPDVPADHPAMGSMLMNMAANMLGLGNAATPLGLRAMRDLERLNPRPGIASDAMCTFLAINTSSVQLVPATAIAILAAAGSARPTAIVGTALLATLAAATVAVVAAKSLQRLHIFQPRAIDMTSEKPIPDDRVVVGSNRDFDDLSLSEPPASRPAMWGSLGMIALLLLFAVFFPPPGQPGSSGSRPLLTFRPTPSSERSTPSQFWSFLFF
jgi:spore maturation protein A